MLLILLCIAGLSLQQSRADRLPAPSPGVLSPALCSLLEQRAGRYAAQLHWPQLHAFYSGRECRPVWLDSNGPNSRASALLATLHQAASEGLSASAYPLPQILELWHSELPQEQLLLELLLSSTFFDYCRHLRAGQIDAQWSTQLWNIAEEEVDSVALLQGAVASNNFELALKSLAPAHPAYQRLREALARYREIAPSGGWPAIPRGPKLRGGDRDPRVPLLRQRLQLEGELQFAPLEDPLLYDQGLRYAIERFQLRHGLQRDGVVGPQTLAELNVPLQRRIEQIRLNMERWRWLPEQLGHRHLIVNVSAYQLSLYDHGERLFTIDAIIGTTEHPTPLITGQLHTVVFNPYWTIPPSIAVEEIIPRQQRDPGYLAAHEIRVYSNREPGKELSPRSIDWAQVTSANLAYILRQDPGPRNPLGKVKFIFSNNYRIYLHDTPEQRLFASSQRAFSHGCIRVAEPLRLASYLLGGRGEPQWNEAALRAAIASGETREVRIGAPLPLYLLYLTAWVGDDGAVHFRRDVYGEDELLLIDLPGRELQ